MDLIDVVSVQVVGPLQLHLQFDDRSEGVVDLTTRVRWTGCFEGLRRDPALFAAATVDPERGVVVWPNGADIDSDLLHAWVHGRAVPAWAGADADDPSPPPPIATP